MSKLLLNKLILSAGSTICFLGLLATATKPVHADLSFEQPSSNSHITFHLNQNEEEKQYIVNGKVLYWHNLTEQQKAKILPIEQNLKAIESQFKAQEAELNLIVNQLNKKVAFVEQEIAGIEQLHQQFEQPDLTVRDMKRVADELAKLSQINQTLLQQHVAAVKDIEVDVKKIDLSMLDDINRHAKALEAVLIEIADES